MIDSARRPRRGNLGVIALLGALLVAVGALGCGSSDDSGTTAGAAAPRPDSEVVAGGERPQAAGSPSRDQGSGDRREPGQGRQDNAPASAGGDVARGAGKKPAGGGNGAADTPSARGGAATVRAAAEHCPPGLDLASCETLVKGAKQSEGSPSYPVTAPDDCLKAMSREECEALYAAQKQAASANGVSVGVEECLARPTPECEAVLRPIFERQREAEEAAG
ncbi:MAG TPA: hypothetical protein VFX85_10370 [Solirubrobacterales bacterium]|nr:hypothetical protein [Solirubrobacterales bacterium]